ncbi:MAG: SUMF1/EgtB/PvdO family nonheme iron enzyme [Rhodoferax sp.]|nr:SUMF1/EgtB/PvdO family nonheme iron enzyme [Rhodoferax sp.]
MNLSFTSICRVLLLLLLAIWAGALPAQGSGGKRLALVIGNDAYKNVDALNNARNDARLMAATLKRANFEVTQVNDLGRESLWQTIDTFKGRIHKGDEVVFYFAGHGVQIKSNQLLLPVDIKASNDDQVQRDGISLVDVQDALKDARFALLVIDACRDNPFIDPRDPKKRTIGGGTRGLVPPEPGTGQAIVMSAGRNQKALDSVPGISQANGLFTWELAQVLQTPGIEIRAALEAVKDRVDDKAKSAGHDQRPSIVSDMRGNFYFFGPTKVQVQNAAADPETEAWTAAKQANTADAYQTYLQLYPQGSYAGAASIALKAAQQAGKLLSAAAAPTRPTTTTPLPSQLSTASSTPPSNLSSDDPEADLWREVKASGAREYLEVYLQQYPKGKYTALARLELKKLDDADRAQRAQEEVQRKQAAEQARQEQLAAAQSARLQQQQAEQDAWATAKSHDSLEAYATYLQNYPQGRYAALAQVARIKVQRETAERERQQAAQREREAEQARLAREEAQRKQAADLARAEQLQSARLDPSKTIKDCADCPELVVIPAGSFTMGSSASEQQHAQQQGAQKTWTDREGPQHLVQVGAFLLGKTEVSVGQWRAFTAATSYRTDAERNAGTVKGCYAMDVVDGKWDWREGRSWKNPGWTVEDNEPVICISWNDASAYVQWMRKRTGLNYSLPSEAQWEYAVRAGTSTSRFWGDDPNAACRYANGADQTAWPDGSAKAWGTRHECKDAYFYVAPVGHYQPNAFGLYDMLGNATEWVQDGFHDDYRGAPTDGSVWTTGGDPSLRVLRGGGWDDNPGDLRSAYRGRSSPGDRNSSGGFRIARTL